ncbi:type II toxin-antitoxin system Xre/ParS family antitoxin [Parahaliea mediterranea]|uniref:type II RES/Xre toxin-antitoxin system antitoxin n=1 Tax=Parahaliea mediterranea TaxID=651086 RepID=UPI0019D4C231|nr:antitoxin Xre-like helix-turn-helix domain-containing protein [Parahaliea mediterranea]
MNFLMLPTTKIYRPVPRNKSGFWETVGLPARGAKLHQVVREGVPYEVFLSLAAVAGLEPKALARYVANSPATLHRRAKAGRFNTDESDRLYRFARVLKAATDLFEGDSKRAGLWMNRPVRGLGGRQPVEMAATSAETEAVLDLIGRMESGVLA